VSLHVVEFRCEFGDSAVDDRRADEIRKPMCQARNVDKQHITVDLLVFRRLRFQLRSHLRQQWLIRFVVVRYFFFFFFFFFVRLLVYDGEKIRSKVTLVVVVVVVDANGVESKSLMIGVHTERFMAATVVRPPRGIGICFVVPMRIRVDDDVVVVNFAVKVCSAGIGFAKRDRVVRIVCIRSSPSPPPFVTIRSFSSSASLWWLA
jgi:hypothetical protein